VIPPNAIEIIKQWTNVHGLEAQPTLPTVVDGHPRQVWVNEAGDGVIESYTIPNMAHGTPLATGKAEDQCGAAGPFLLEVGISSSYHIARFFGLTNFRAPGASESTKTRNVMALAKKLHESGTSPAGPQVLEGEVLEPEFDSDPAHPHVPSSSHIDVGAVITNALRAAGLMKGS
jgi:feruloyl esterase